MDFDLLKRICETPGVPGREEAMRRLVAAELRGLVDEVTTDAMGNLIGVKRGSGGPRVMLAAHMDEIGFVVKHIDERGFLRIHPLGGWDPRTMMAQRVYVHGSQGSTLLGALMPVAKPIHMLSPEDAARSPKIDEFFVDLGMPYFGIAIVQVPLESVERRPHPTVDRLDIREGAGGLGREDVAQHRLVLIRQAAVGEHEVVALIPFFAR